MDPRGQSTIRALPIDPEPHSRHLESTSNFVALPVPMRGKSLKTPAVNGIQNVAQAVTNLDCRVTWYKKVLEFSTNMQGLTLIARGASCCWRVPTTQCW